MGEGRRERLGGRQLSRIWVRGRHVGESVYPGSLLVYSSQEIVNLCPTVNRWMLRLCHDDWKYEDVGRQVFGLMCVLPCMVRFSEESIARVCTS